MLSHIFTQFIVLLGQITITLVFVFLVFKIPCNGPVGWIVVIAILQGFAGMCYGKIIFCCVYVKNQKIFNYWTLNIVKIRNKFNLFDKYYIFRIFIRFGDIFSLRKQELSTFLSSFFFQLWSNIGNISYTLPTDFFGVIGHGPRRSGRVTSMMMLRPCSSSLEWQKFSGRTGHNSVALPTSFILFF